MSRESKSSSKIRYAVVGLGHIGQVAVLLAFKTSKNSELVSIVSGESEKREQLGKKYRLDHLYSYEDYDRALSEVDAVYIAVPNHLHREYAVRAAYFYVDVTTARLNKISELFDSRKLATNVGTVLPLEQARTEHEMLGGEPHKRGKIVLSIAA